MQFSSALVFAFVALSAAVNAQQCPVINCPAVTVTVTARPTTTTVRPITTTTTARPVTTTTTAGTACAAKFGQCGGTGFTGPKCCQSGSTCTVSSQYYSQCL